MKQSTIKSASLLTPPVGGLGARKYIKPRIEIIFLDNEISLALASEAPPVGPSEGNNNTHNPLSNNPFNDTMA